MEQKTVEELMVEFQDSIGCPENEKLAVFLVNLVSDVTHLMERVSAIESYLDQRQREEFMLIKHRGPVN